MPYYYPQAAMTLRIVFEDFRLDTDAGPPTILGNEYVLHITPKRLSVKINDYTQADTFSCEIDYRNFPFDPRSIRALGVTIFIQDMGHLVDGMTGKRDRIEPSDGLTPGKPSNVVFQGFADEESISLNDSARTISFEGRDFTSLLIDMKWDRESIDLFKPVSVVIQKILRDNKSTENIWIDNKVTGILPNIGSYAPDYKPLAAKRNNRKNESYWDVIQHVIGLAGLVAYIQIDKLVITKPRVLYKKDRAKQFIYGKNIKSLNFKRKLGRMKGLNVKVMSLIDKKVLKIDIPKQADKDWLKAMGLKAADLTVVKIKSNGEKENVKAPFSVHRLPHINDDDHLRDVGQGIFEEIGRQQIEGDLETNDMSVCEGKTGVPTSFDITKMRNGTPIDISIEGEHLKGIRKIDSNADRQKYLIDKKYPPLVAAALAESLGKFATPFYTKAITFDFDTTSGFKMRLDFINFIELSDRLLGL